MCGNRIGNRFGLLCVRVMSVLRVWIVCLVNRVSIVVGLTVFLFSFPSYMRLSWAIVIICRRTFLVLVILCGVSGILYMKCLGWRSWIGLLIRNVVLMIFLFILSLYYWIGGRIRVFLFRLFRLLRLVLTPRMSRSRSHFKN